MHAFASLSRSLRMPLAGCVSLLALAGCAQEEGPTLGQRIAAVGESHAQLASEWESAEAKKDQAEDDVRAAKTAIKQAEKDLDQANEDLEDANERMVEARRDLAGAEAEAERRGVAPRNTR